MSRMLNLNLCIKMAIVACGILAIIADNAFGSTLGGIASNVTSSFKNLAKLITAASYIAGIAFAIGAILKFKQHKDNPTQIPIGTPIALVVIGAALLFLPSLLSVTGETIFGGSGSTAGPTGTIFSSNG